MPINMQTHLEQEISSLRMKVLEMAAYAEKALDKSLRALTERNSELAQEVIDKDYEINQLECEIDEFALRLLALAQPVARDLRFIVGCMRIIVNLERIGDEAVNISERSMLLAHRPPLPFSKPLEQLSQVCLEMLRTAIKAFKDDDSELADQVCTADEQANELDMTVLRNLIDYMVQQSPAVERSVHSILASRSLERVGDLSTNIAECVIFIVQGVDVKHRCHRF